MPLIEALETLIKPVVENEGAYVHELSLVVERVFCIPFKFVYASELFDVVKFIHGAAS